MHGDGDAAPVKGNRIFFWICLLAGGAQILHGAGAGGGELRRM
jgi:hypothetical protein